MIRPFAAFLLTLSAAAAFSALPVQAQYYPPSPYYRGAPPDVYQDRLPPPGYSTDDDDYGPGVPPPRYDRRGYQAQQQQDPRYQRGTARGPAYPEEADVAPPPPPGFAPPYGRPPQYDRQYGPQQTPGMAPPMRQADPYAVRPPGSVGNPPGIIPQPVPPTTTASLPPEDQPEQGQPKELSPELRRQLVDYPTQQPAGTLVIDTPHTFLYLVLGNGKALRYGIGVGREGFTWAGTERISKMKDWPDWFPPPEMIERQPYLPRMMAGGPGNPLGARALYLGNTLYRIHGTNQPSTIGTFVSSGCIRLINEDIEDLYNRVQVGTRVVVLPGGKPPETADNGNPPPSEPDNPMAPPRRAGNAVSAAPLPPPH